MIKRILLIDDDEDEMELLTQAFRQIKIDADWQYEKLPENAIATVKEFQPDLLFLDYNMPKINGLVCLKEIRSLPALDQVMVVFYSTNLTEEVQKKATALGATGCIEKTYSVGALVTKIKKIIRAKDLT